MGSTKITCRAVLFCMLFISGDAFSQNTGLRKWEAGLHLGGFIYQGDLTPSRYGAIEKIKPGIGIYATRIISRSFSARLLFNMANLAADESIYKTPAFRRQRNFAFTASVKELTLLAHWNIFGSNYDERKIEPYIFAGGGASILNVTRDYSRFNALYFGETSPITTGLAVDAATPTPQIIMVVPVGAGLRYNVSERIAVSGELMYRIMRTDYLDGFSMSADPNQKDHYSSLTVGIAYKFAGKEKYSCPTAN